VAEIVNLICDLNASAFESEAKRRALAHLDAAAYSVRFEDGENDRVLAWIDDLFGGAWSSEAFAGQNVVAYRDDAPAGFATFAPRGLRYAWLRGIAAEPDVGVFGPIGIDPSHRGGPLGAALLTIALCELHARGYTRAVIPAVGPPPLIDYYRRHAQARVVERFELRSLTGGPVRTVVMASGNGTNLQAVLDRVAGGTLPLDVRALVTNRENAYAIERAKRAGVPAIHVLPWRRKEVSRAAYDAELLEVTGREAPELVLLLGWMHLLDNVFVERFRHLINVHPAFLPLEVGRDVVGMPDGSQIPAFRGAHAVRDALALHSTWVGASVHLVTSQIDRGPVLVRKPLRISAEEDEAAVLERLHPIEHNLVERGILRWLYER
jgi:phosphoribosylglycinamide formyltransferase 1